MTGDDRSHAAERPRPLPSITASVPRSRMTSTLPAFTIPVADSRMSSTLPANSLSTKLSMPGNARRGFRRKDVNRRDRRSCQSGGSKQRRSDKRDELVLRVVPIDISDDNERGPCQRDNVNNSDVKEQSTDEPGNDDDSDSAPCQFQRTATVRQGKYFKKSAKRCLSDATAEVLPGSNDEHPHQVRSLCTSVVSEGILALLDT